jgi:archaetidylinositol phosphate synthase
MIETYLRPVYQSMFAYPKAKQLQHVQPLQITYFSCLSGMIAALMIVIHFPLTATLFLLSSGFLDTLDGTIARTKNKSSPLDSIVDILSGRIVEFLVILGLFMVDPHNRAGASLFMLGACYLCVTSFLVVGNYTPRRKSEYPKKGFHYSPGLIERAGAFLFFIFMIWFPNYFNSIAFLFSILVLLTTYLRIKQFTQYDVKVS